MVASRPNDGGKEWPQILAIFSASLTALSYGVQFSWTSPSIPKLLDEGVTLEEASYLTVLSPVCTILTTFPCSKLIDVIGRKRTLLSSALLHLICWALIIKGGELWVYYLAKLVNGVADSAVYCTLPAYIGEIATPKVRGSWGNVFVISVYTGMLFINVVGSICTIRVAGAISASVPVVFVLTFAFMPETPYYLLSKDREDEARKSLQWLRRKDNVDAELNDIGHALKRQRAEASTFRDMFVKPSSRRAVVVCVILRAHQLFCGIVAFESYTQIVFRETGSSLSATTSSVIFIGILAGATLLASPLLDRLGRRKSMHISGVGCTFFLLIMAVYLTLKETMDLSALTWFPLLGMMGYITFFALALGSVPTLMLGELFSASVKANALALMNLALALMTAIVTKLFQVLLSAYGINAPFFFFGFCCFVGTIACYLMLPETRGRTLDEIQLSLEGKDSRKKSMDSEKTCHI